MNILHIISKIDTYDVVSGVLDLSRHLNDSGHNCIIASSVDSPFKNKSQIKHYPLPLYELNFWNVYGCLKKIIHENRIDIVHTHSPLTSLTALFVSRNTETSLITTCHNFYPKKNINGLVLLGKRVIVHHEALGRYLLDKFNLARERLQFIKPGLDLGSFSFQAPDERSKTDFNIGMISPLAPTQGHEYFLKAMVKVVRSHPNIKIWIITSMPGSKHNFKGELELWARRLGLNNYVEFFSPLQLDFSILSKFNVLVFFPIKEDASTRIILESQARGVPVVASYVPAVAEVIQDSSTGILVPPMDHNALANAIIKILRDSQLQKDIAYRARKRIVGEFNLKNIAAEYIGVYETAKNSTKILMINLGRAQDVIAAIPAAGMLKKKIPQAELICLTARSLRCLLEHCPYIDGLIIHDYSSKKKSLLGFIEIAQSLIAQRFDIVVDFSNTFITHLLSYFSLASKRYGYKNRIFKFFINYGIDRLTDSLDMVHQKISILKPLGIDSKDYKIELWSSPDDIESVENFLKDNWIGRAKVAGLDISYRKSLEHTAHLCDRLANLDLRVIIMGLKDNVIFKKRLLKKIKSKPILALDNFSIMQQISLIKKCNIYISSNLESLNIAASMNVPTIILSPTNNLNKIPAAYKKQTEILTQEEVQLDILKKKAKRKFTGAVSQDLFLEKINRLLKR